MKYVTVAAPVRYAKWLAQPTRNVGKRLLPGEILPLKDEEIRDYKFVAEGEQGETHLTISVFPPRSQ